MVYLIGHFFWVVMLWKVVKEEAEVVVEVLLEMEEEEEQLELLF